MEAQLEAAKVIIQAKRQRNQENSIGLMTLAGPHGPQVLLSLSQDSGSLYKVLASVSLKGEPCFVNAVQIAQLALKHRLNKSQQQRIIVFVGSPLQFISLENLSQLAKTLKKNGIAVDIVNISQNDENEKKFSSFINTVAHDNNRYLSVVYISSNLVNISSCTGDVLSDAIVSSPILSGYSSEHDFPFGVDPDLDPELALALRMSLEEERNRQATLSNPPVENSSDHDTSANKDDEGDEDAELAMALAMSMDTSNSNPKPRSPKRKLDEGNLSDH